MSASSQSLALAQALIRVGAAHEASYDRLAADKERDFSIEEVDFNKFYRLTLWEACELEAGEHVTPAYLLLTQSHNEALDWANEVLGISIDTAKHQAAYKTPEQRAAMLGVKTFKHEE